MRKIVVLLSLTVIPAAVSAQNDLIARCNGVISIEQRQYCNLIAETIDMAQPRFGIAASGGNPVPGAASTLGMRLGKVPRISVALRGTTAKVDLPSIRMLSDNGEIDFLLSSLNVDAAVGVFSGFSPLPTIGGVGSIDVLASAGLLFVPDEGGFRDDTKKSWAIGTRIGILRESFTAPGVAVTGMYRRVGDIQFGNRDATFLPPSSGFLGVVNDAFFELSDLSALSVRGTVGKKLLSLGAVAGVGYDRYASDVTFRHSDTTHEVDGFDNDRLTIFGNLSYTLLVLSLNGELGWQNGADEFKAPLPPGRSSDAGKSAWYGSLALRLSI